MCRTQNGADINAGESFKRNIESVIKEGKLCDDILSAAQKDSRGNIAPSTIILPTLAMEAKEKGGNIVENFMSTLDEAIHDAKDSLIERYNWICSQSPASASFMWDNRTFGGYIPEEGIKSAFRHGTLSIGLLDLSTALKILIGCDHTTEKGMDLAKRVIKLYTNRCNEFKEKYKLNFATYYTPKI